MAKPFDKGTRDAIAAKIRQEKKLKDDLTETQGVLRLPQIPINKKIHKVVKRHEN